MSLPRIMWKCSCNRRPMPIADLGPYLLGLRCAPSRAVRIGRLGSIGLRLGYYLYVGTAFGPGGLRARIDHHRKRGQRPHWHVDYLRRYTRLESVRYAFGERREHEWATKLAPMSGAAILVRGVGTSYSPRARRICPGSRSRHLRRSWDRFAGVVPVAAG